VDLQHELRLQLGNGDRAGRTDHRQLDDVGGRSLNHGVDGEALTEHPALAIRRTQLRDVAPATHQGLHMALVGRLGNRCVDEPLDGWEALEIAVDVERGFLALDLEAVGETERRQPIGDAVVDHLRL
jgi:hypothetical protein